MIDERIFLRFPISFGDVCKVYPPSVNDVIGLDVFNTYRAALMLSQEEIEDAYIDDNIEGNIPTPFQYLLITYYQENDKIKKILEDAFSFFIKEPVAIFPELETIVIGKKEEDIIPDEDLINPRVIDANNYFEFQNIIRLSMGLDSVEAPNPNEHPRIKRYKAKMRQREKTIARKKANSSSLGNLLSAICCMGIGLNPLNIGEISYASVGWLIETYQGKEAYDVDIRCLLAGADSKKVKPKYWIK